MTHSVRRTSGGRTRPHPRRPPLRHQVLLHNDAGGPAAAAKVVLDKFEPDLHGVMTALDDLRDNFGDIEAQGTQAYADEMARNHEHLDRRDLLSEGLSAVQDFHRFLTERES
jgi:hypothetical protein